MKIKIKIKADKTLIKAISDLKDVLEKANAISIPKVWVNERPVITTGGAWKQQQPPVATSGSYTWHPDGVTGTDGPDDSGLRGASGIPEPNFYNERGVEGGDGLE